MSAVWTRHARERMASRFAEADPDEALRGAKPPSKRLRRWILQSSPTLAVRERAEIDAAQGTRYLVNKRWNVVFVVAGDPGRLTVVTAFPVPRNGNLGFFGCRR